MRATYANAHRHIMNKQAGNGSQARERRIWTDPTGFGGGRIGGTAGAGAQRQHVGDDVIAQPQQQRTQIVELTLGIWAIV
jgi:hypothetical protein